VGSRISFQKTIIKLKEEAKAQDEELDKLTKKAFKNLLPSIAIQKLKKGTVCVYVYVCVCAIVFENMVDQVCGGDSTRSSSANSHVLTGSPIKVAAAASLAYIVANQATEKVLAVADPAMMAADKALTAAQVGYYKVALTTGEKSSAAKNYLKKWKDAKKTVKKVCMCASC
jgi:hypothetical protein